MICRNKSDTKTSPMNEKGDRSTGNGKTNEMRMSSLDRLMVEMIIYISVKSRHVHYGPLWTFRVFVISLESRRLEFG